MEEKEEKEEKILEIIREHEGIRMREIRGHFDNISLVELIGLLGKLEKANKIKRVLYNDPANMEFYDRWFIKKG